MRLPGFIYGSNESQSFTADQERTINFYVELPTAPGERAVLLPTPGVKELDNAGAHVGVRQPGRAHFYDSGTGREFAVFGSGFWEAAPSGTLTYIGEVGDDGQPATISSNGDGGGELFITSATNAYYFTLSSGVLTQITALNGKATMGDFLDGYFLAFDTATSTLYLSALLDGSSWTTGTDFAQRSIAPDPWVSMKVHGRYVWLIGTETSEAWYSAGGSFPLALHPSSFIRYGTRAPWSVAVTDDSILWLSNSRFGSAGVVRTQGFTPKAVSTFAVANDIGSLRNPLNARGDVYSDLGHTFYLLNLPGGSTTWVLDLTTNIWHERATWISVDRRYEAWRPGFFVRAFDQLRCLDGGGASLYWMHRDLTTDVVSGYSATGTSLTPYAIRRLRRAPALNNENRRMFYRSFELGLDRGQGDGTTGQGANPQVMLRWSDDGGKTWGNEHWVSAGKIGEYDHRARWTRLGVGRRRVFEVVMSDPVPYRLVDAYMDAVPEFAQSA